jgi:hypothetical protein
MNYDEEVRFDSGADDGENTNTSIQPISDDEVLVQAPLRRPTENVRVRMETVREILKELLFRTDYDTYPLLSSSGQFTCTLVAGAPSTWTLAATSELVITPGRAPGYATGGRPQTIGTRTMRGARLFVGSLPYAGVLGVNDLHIYADPGTTGQRASHDGEDMDTLTVTSVGANDISVELAMDPALGVGVIIIDPVTGTPTRHISIRYADGVGLQALVSAINGDKVGGATQSQGGGTWGIGEMIQAGTSLVPPADVALTGLNIITITKTTLQGGYDAEAHVVTPAQLAAFFAVAGNPLQDGEGLAFAYAPGPVEVGGSGGRRQSILDFSTSRLGLGAADNSGRLAAGIGALFNTAVHPELVPGSIPIGRLLKSCFVFADGTVLPAPAVPGAGPALYLGESGYTYAALASVATPGASLVGMTQSPNWYADGPPAPAFISAADLETWLDDLVTHLTAAAAGDSGSRRLGAEPVTGTSSSGNSATTVSLVASSIRGQLDQILNKLDGGGNPIGLNARVSERGHVLHGLAPIEKDLEVEAAGGGGEVIRARTGAQLNASSSASVAAQNQGFTFVQPLQFSIAAGRYLLATESVENPGGLGAVNRIRMNGPDLATRRADLIAALPCGNPLGGLTGVTTWQAGLPGPVQYNIQHILCHLTVPAATAFTGYYYLATIGVGGNDVLALYYRTGSVVPPDFTGVDFTGATITFFDTLTIGNDYCNQRIRAYHTGNAAWLSLAQRNPAAAILETFHYDTVAGEPRRNIGITPGRALFLVPGATATLVRDTENIPVTTDKALLDGNETGVVVDASTSHHHDGRYDYYIHDILRTHGGEPTVGGGDCYTWDGIVGGGHFALLADALAPDAQIVTLDAVASAAGFAKDAAFWVAPNALQQSVSHKIVNLIDVDIEVHLVGPGAASGMMSLLANFKVMSACRTSGDNLVMLEASPTTAFDGGTVYGDAGILGPTAVCRQRFTLAVGDLYDGGTSTYGQLGVGVQYVSVAGSTQTTSFVKMYWIGEHRCRL